MKFVYKDNLNSIFLKPISKDKIKNISLTVKKALYFIIMG